jgi:hypothetical protein
MADEDNVRRCAAACCSCAVEAGQKYCGPSCQGSGDTIQLDCDCGHDGCQGDF